MRDIQLGVDERNDFAPVFLSPDKLARHMHIVGQTGAGKTVALHAILRALMKEPGIKRRMRRQCSMFVIDPMGGLSRDLLQWMASSRCPEHVRRRLLYIEPARDEFVLPFNPLEQAVGDARYYHVSRTVDLILRAWAAQDLSQQPRLMQWAYKTMTAVARLGLPIAASRYLLHPGTLEHRAILSQIPDEIAAQWNQILQGRSNEAVKVLESTRNRFEPIYEAPQTRRMMGITRNRFDVAQLIRDRRIVIVNVAKLGKVPHLLGETIGGFIANEIFETADKMSGQYGRESVDPTYLVMDEFQKFVGPDIEDALPTVRQMGLRFILAHQSFSQLERQDIDLTSMIWQAQNRLLFANAARDADIVAEELAKLTFDPKRVKEQRVSRKQLITGYRTEWLESVGTSTSHTDSNTSQWSSGTSRLDGESYEAGSIHDRQVKRGTGTTHGSSTGRTKADGQSNSHSRSQSLVPIHETIEEISKEFVSFEEHNLEWDRIIRQLRTGTAFGQFVDDDHLYKIHVDHRPVRETPSIARRVEELIQRNFEQDCFISKQEAERQEAAERLRLLQQQPIVIPEHTGMGAQSPHSIAESKVDPFNRPGADG